MGIIAHWLNSSKSFVNGPSLPTWLTRSLLHGFEAVQAAVPRTTPNGARLSQCRIVSHRGERDNRVVFENTFAAFDCLIDAGVWAIEFDIRWTRDLEPVVVHDLDLYRVFNQTERIRDLTLAQLRRTAPQIPTLAELVQRYGADLHLMIEIKAEHYPDAARQQQRLQDILSGLTPGRDFHFLALETSLFDHVDRFAPACWLPVARTNIKQMSEFALARGCAGFAGPYALISRQRIEIHRRAGQQVGAGFPAHRNVLLREINRGVDWLFSNHALRLQTALNDLQSKAF